MGIFWDTEKVFIDGDEYFDHLIADIDQAKSLITVEIYIFNNDHLGLKIAEHLIEAQKRGVKVEIIVDGIGSYNFYDKLHGLFTSSQIRVKVFHPLPFLHPFYGKLPFRKKISAFASRLWKLNQRDHRKIITIDSSIMYTGSFNFTAEHTSYYQGKKWKDMGVRVTGINVQIALLYFKKIWKIKDYFQHRKLLRKLKLKDSKYSLLRLNHSLIKRRFYYKDLIQKLNRSKKQVWLVTPYFIPTPALIIALGKAAVRGVDVRILISAETDVKVFKTLKFFYLPFLIKRGVRVFEYVETVLHAKIFMIDDWVTVGSSNLNHRSILHDLEVDLSIQDPKNIEIIRKDFISSTSSEIELTAIHLQRRSLIDRFLSRLFYLIKYWF